MSETLVHPPGGLVEHLTEVVACPALLCQAFYLLAGAAILAIAALPTPERLLSYGARQSSSLSTEGEEEEEGPLARLIAAVTSVGQVPHSWFTHFYLISVALSGFWAWQYASHGGVLGFITRWQTLCSGTGDDGAPPSMTASQVIIVLLLMGLQGARRLYECLFVFRPSASRMWGVHWLLGIGFYTCTSVAVWVEGSPSIWLTEQQASMGEGVKEVSFQTLLGVSVFFTAWTMQHRCHKHLCSLKKYTLPDQGLFKYLVCPHYTCECLIYLGLAITAAPTGQLYNRTLLCAVIFTLTGLGVTARGTKAWYEEKFGAEKLRGKWRIVPFLY